ncbi:MAG: AtpZ/AtpI family protein [Planctomyces sp.]|jgi:hypothetical protein
MSQGRRRISEIAEAHRTANDVVSSALGIALFAGGGYYLDSRFGWSPVLTIVGAVFGFVSAGFSLRNLLRRLDGEARRRRACVPGVGESERGAGSEVESR